MKKTLLFLIALQASLFSMHAQSVYTVAKSQSNISASDAGSYDRILDLNWQLEAGTTYLLSLPAKLDGYYFGTDARRLNVLSYEKKNGSWYVVTCGDMADLDDFLPYKAYLVTPALYSESITHITAGIKTDLPVTPGGKQILHTTVDDVVTSISGSQNDSGCFYVVYDMQGRRVSSVKKGETYLINGKKVTIK